MNTIIKNDLDEIINTSVPWDCFNKKTILITGATGMIPSYMALTLLRCNEVREGFECRVIALVRNKNKAKRLFKYYLDKSYLLITEESLLQPLNDKFGNIDYIIHGASPASPQLFVENPVGTLEPNVIGTYNILNSFKEDNIEGFLLLSSGDVYGQTPEGEYIREDSLGIVDQLNIRNVYAESKRMAETICRSFFEQYDIPAKLARISHTYGPTIDFTSDRRVFSEFVQNIINNEDIVMKSSGEAVRPFCYLTDAAVGLFLILLCGKPGEAYNLCNDKCSVSIRELALELINIFPQKNLRVICEDRDINDTYKESLVSVPCSVDNSKIRELGWKPHIDIKTGFKRMIESLMK